MKTPRWVPALYLGPAILVMAAACLYPVLSAFQLAGYDWAMGTPWTSAPSWYLTNSGGLASPSSAKV